MALGNPGSAMTLVTNRTNYLKDNTPRQNDFRADETLPQNYYRVQIIDYNGSGFERGAEDRDGNV